MILNRAVSVFAKSMNLYRITRTVVDREPVEQLSDAIPIRASIQPARKNMIKKDIIDYSLDYAEFHVLTETIKMGDIIEYKGVRYKVYDVSDRSDNGYFLAQGEEINNDT